MKVLVHFFHSKIPKLRSSRAGAFFALVLMFIPTSLFALDFRVRVFDPATGKGVSDVQVIILETKTRLFTGPGGYASAEVPGPGFYTFRAIIPGGELLQPRLQVNSPGQVVSVYTTPPGENQGVPEDQTQTVGRDGIQVMGEQDKTKLSRYQVRLDEIKRIPGQFGDAMKGLETLPGVTPPNFGTGEIVVRGADPDWTKYLVDNLPIGYAYHFGGLNQVLHNDIIQTIDLYTGSYPAKFGDATGGIVYITTKDEVQKFSGHVTASLWNTNVEFESPIGDEDGQADGYWIGAGRISYLDVVLGAINVIPDGVRVPRYWDGQFKIMYRLSPSQKLYFYFMGAKDTFALEVKEKYTWDPTQETDPMFIGAGIALDTAFHTEAIRHEWQPTADINNQLSIINYDNILYYNGRIGDYEAAQNRHTGYYSLKDDFKWGIYKENVVFSGGLELRTFRYSTYGEEIIQLDPSDENPDPYDTENPDFETVPIDDSEEAPYTSGYGMITIRGYGFEFKPGFRYEYFAPVDHEVVDPRGTLSYSIEDWGTTLIGGAGVYHRVPDPRFYSESTGNPDLLMEEAKHYALGLEQRLFQTWTFKIEGFRHYYEDLVVNDVYITTAARLKKSRDPGDIKSVAQLNAFLDFLKEPIEYNDRLSYSNDGTGFSEGYEIYLKRSLRPDQNGWFGWISYYWSRSLRNDHQHIITDHEKDLILTADERRILNQYDNTKDGYSDYDRTVVANLVIGYKPSREWQFGARWNYRTAQPYTPIVGDDGGRQVNRGRVIFDPVYSDYKNSARLKPYHRLDIRIDRFIHYSWGYANVFIEALNVYVRDNEVSKSWSSAYPYSATNPSTVYDFGLYTLPQGGGKVMKTPMYNFGLEIKF